MYKSCSESREKLVVWLEIIFRTSRLTPVAFEFVIAIRLVADESFRPLFDDRRPVHWSDSHFDLFLQRNAAAKPRGDTATRNEKEEGMDNRENS